MSEQPGSESSLDPSRMSVGDIVEGYVIVGHLGCGGFGCSYVAHNPLLDRRVVLKVHDSARIPLPETRDRLLLAIRTAARFHGMGICLIHDFREIHGRPVVAREFVEGEPLSGVLRDGKAFSREETLTLVAHLADALAAAHDCGLPHLALKPSNIIINECNDPIIVDFVTNEAFAIPSGPRLVGALAPTAIAYMSLEQVYGDQPVLDPRMDIYSLGVILYHLYAGRPPFQGSALEIARQILRGDPPPPSSFRSDGDTRVDAICRAALRRRVTDRYQTMREMAEALRSALAADAQRSMPEEVAIGAPHQDSLWKVLSGTRAAEPRPSRPLERPIAYDEEVQFTVYRPSLVQPGVWYDMLAFAHLSRRRDDAPASEPDPVEEVQRQARQLLAERAQDYRDVTQDSRQAVPREGEITFLPEVPGFQFNPPRRVFRWVESVHREQFRFQASEALQGQTARGKVTVFLGGIILAEVALSIRVDRRESVQPLALVEAAPRADHARPYRKIFASYSHKDVEIVRQFELFARTLGDEYLRDEVQLRSGQIWNDRIKGLIRQADLFQLFWSTSAMRSPFVREEWEYALSLGRDLFVRPTYWEDPLPASLSEELPPQALRRLHFQRISVAVGRVRTPDRPCDAADRRVAVPAAPALKESRGSASLQLELDLKRPPRSTPQPGAARPRSRLTRMVAGAVACTLLLAAGASLLSTRKAPVEPAAHDRLPKQTSELSGGPKPRPRDGLGNPVQPDALQRAMSAAAGEIGALLESRNARRVAMGEFVSRDSPMLSCGPAITKALADSLTEIGVAVGPGSDFEINGEIRVVGIEEAKAPAVEVAPRLVDRSSHQSIDLHTRETDDETTVAILTGATVTLPADGAYVARAQALAQAIRHPAVRIGGALVQAGPGSPFAMEIVVTSEAGGDARPRVPSLGADGFAVASLAPGETFAVRLINDSTEDVAVTLSIDGLSVLRFNDRARLASSTLPARLSATFRGWVGSGGVVEPFVAGRYAHARQERLQPRRGRGTITATFAAMPRRTNSAEGGARPEEGPLKAAISVRYTAEDSP
jgi:serine/threonine protein kinase